MSRGRLYYAELKLTPNWDALRGIMILAFFDFVGIAFYLHGLIFYSPYDDKLLLFLFFLILGLVMLNTILWNVNGKESIEVTAEKITIKKKGKLFTSINFIEFYELESISLDHSNPLPGKLYPFNAGKIIFKYLGMEKRVGQNLELKEAETIVNELNNLISSLRTNNDDIT